MRPLSLEWFKHVPPEKKGDYETVIRNSTLVLGLLYDLCNDWEDELSRAETKITDYDNPNWACKTAHRNGDRSRVRKLRDLLSFLKGDLKNV